VNPFAGAGTVLLIALIAVLLSAVPHKSMLLLGLSATIIIVSLSLWMASAKRRRHDYRAAFHSGRR
jgi:hypothetical protein